MGGSSLVQATMIFVIGSLAVCAQCSLHNKQTGVNQDDYAANATTNATIVNSTSVGESKITVKFCIRHFLCQFPGGYHGTCYCCQNNRQCYKMRSQCLDNCPTCNPRCPPLSGSQG
ncbi:unnamed protein product [Triticum turgidum subsp. durum]|uniref:Embryo surrounding factor 1 brassicaceae domain-containing protein n=1 Tax=Triticum turgidum subsp. durum TaxID=4567 RepID=A0A9R0Z3V5_TRITD|nr:unnamed protein product [Triticum turgidum subsp. durum]